MCARARGGAFASLPTPRRAAASMRGRLLRPSHSHPRGAPAIRRPHRLVPARRAGCLGGNPCIEKASTLDGPILRFARLACPPDGRAFARHLAVASYSSRPCRSLTRSVGTYTGPKADAATGGSSPCRRNAARRRLAGAKLRRRHHEAAASGSIPRRRPKPAPPDRRQGIRIYLRTLPAEAERRAGVTSCSPETQSRQGTVLVGRGPEAVCRQALMQV